MPTISGVWVDHQLQSLRENGGIVTDKPLEPGQIQPASMDLRLGAHAYRVQASVLPMRGETVEQAIKPLIMYDFSLNKQPRLLERGSIYMVKLQEGLKLPQGVSGIASPKSSTGRLDVFVRLLTDSGEVFDRVPEGYEGPLWLEVMPLTFPIEVRAGDRMIQLRLRQGNTVLSDTELLALDAQTPLLHRTPTHPTTIQEGVWISIDLAGQSEDGREGQVIGYRAKAHTQTIDLTKVGQHPWQTYWEPIYATHGQPLILYPEEFYIFASLEQVTVPSGYSAELVAYDTRVGELRLHYAGFFDPGWGMVNGKSVGTRAVLEVRAHDVPCVLRHGQRLGRFVYEKLAATPNKLYGQEIASNYTGQGLKLAKYFTAQNK